MDPGAAKRRQRKLLLRTVAAFSKKRAGIQRDAGQIIRQHSPLNAPQHLGAAAEASTSSSTIDPSTSEERQMPVEDIETLLQELYRLYRTAQGEDLLAIQNVAEDVIKNALATGELSAVEVRAALMRFSIYPAVADEGTPTEIVDDNGCNLVANESSPDERSPTRIVDDTGCILGADVASPEDKIIDHGLDFFNAFEDDFDDKDLD